MKQKFIIKKKFVTFLFIYLFLFTSYFSIITLSKYVGIINKSGTMAIAKWDVSLDTSANASSTLNMTIGNANTNASYILKITSLSETKANYSIVLSDLPKGVEVKLDNGNYKQQVNNKIIFDDVGYINANADTNDKTKTHTLTFGVSIGSDTISESEINIDVIFNQENPSGN